MQHELDEQWKRFQNFLQTQGTPNDNNNNNNNHDDHDLADEHSNAARATPDLDGQLGARSSAQYSHTQMDQPNSPTSLLSVKQIRRELALYGVPNDEGCVEKQDLIARLKAARAKQKEKIEQQKREQGLILLFGCCYVDVDVDVDVDV